VPEWKVGKPLPEEESMRKTGDILGSLILIFAGIMVIIGSIGLRLGTPTEPQPGFLPFVSAIILIILSLILLIQAFHGSSTGFQTVGELWRPLLLTVGLLFYSIVLDLLGYVIATIILSAVILRVLDTRTWWKVAAVSLALSIGSYVLFDGLLGVTLPHGILEGVM
jgi:putative tricarboxylic transport membrane protein